MGKKCIKEIKQGIFYNSDDDITEKKSKYKRGSGTCWKTTSSVLHCRILHSFILHLYYHKKYTLYNLHTNTLVVYTLSIL